MKTISIIFMLHFFSTILLGQQAKSLIYPNSSFSNKLNDTLIVIPFVKYKSDSIFTKNLICSFKDLNEMYNNCKTTIDDYKRDLQVFKADKNIQYSTIKKHEQALEEMWLENMFLKEENLELTKRKNQLERSLDSLKVNSTGK